MRYLIETVDGDLMRSLEDGKTFNNTEIIERYDKFEKITAQLQAMKTALELFQREGYSRKILVGYLRSKNISGRMVVLVLNEIEEFFRLTGLKED